MHWFLIVCSSLERGGSRGVCLLCRENEISREYTQDLIAAGGELANFGVSL